MECRIKDFYILTIKNITYLNQEIYSNKTVEYKNTLYWDELILFKDCYATVILMIRYIISSPTIFFICRAVSTRSIRSRYSPPGISSIFSLFPTFI